MALNILKLVNGDLIVGEVETTGRFSVVVNPYQFILTENKTFLVKYNIYSKNNFITIEERNVIYFDIPADSVVKTYNELISGKAKKNQSHFEPSVFNFGSDEGSGSVQ